MASVELIMPKMGESIMEATILKWLKKEGDRVELDETILEIATDKVDSEIPSPVEGRIEKILFKENDTVEIGKVIALIATENEVDGASATEPEQEEEHKPEEKARETSNGIKAGKIKEPEPVIAERPAPDARLERISPGTGRFYSPLVRNIARKEGVSMEELDQIEGSGLHGRVTKQDMLGYLEERKDTRAMQKVEQKQPDPTKAETKTPEDSPVSTDGNVEIIEMDRMRKLIADHMVRSKQTSPHVTSFVEADVTNIVNWRNRIKSQFQKEHGQKITYTPLFIEAIVKAISDFPMINISVDGDRIIRKKDIHIGIATALPSGNLIVPVIKSADSLNLLGLTKAVNDLAGRARDNKLKPEEVQGGTFTLTNVGTFGNVMGTPIINQPQVAIMAAGAIRKKPAVVETEYGDLIAIRQLMFLSMSYDHRVVDGLLGGSFLRRVADYLEAFDPQTTF